MADSRARRSLAEILRRLWRRIRRKPQSPEDPYAYRPVYVRSGPKGRSGAAVAEPEEDSYQAHPSPRRI